MAATNTTNQTTQTPRQGKTVLLVDDDPVVLKIYQRQLEKAGYRVATAEDGLAAMRALTTHKPDLVVLDLMMPKLNGVDVLKFMRGNQTFKSVPVIVLSNAYMTELAEQAMALGADKGLLKSSCTPSILLQCINDVFAGTTGVRDTSHLLAVEGQPRSGKPASKGPTSVGPETSESVDPVMVERVRDEFVRDGPAEAKRLRQLCDAFIAVCHTNAGRVALENFYQRVHFIGRRAAIAGFGLVELLSNAFEALLFEMLAREFEITPSLLHTIQKSMYCLEQLLINCATGLAEGQINATVLVVDDDAVSNRVMAGALRKVGLKVDTATDPQTAITQMLQHRYDLVVSDVLMPDMNGFELCTQIRTFPGYQNVPVIFVTVLDDFESRMRGAECGYDFISKPIIPLELALKATTILIISRIEGAYGTARGR